MSKHTAASLFMLSPYEVKSAALYQALLRGIGSYQQLGERLIQLAEQAHAFRQFDKVKEMGLMLSNIPIRNYQAIGHYFLGIATNSKGNGDQDKARRLLESIADTAPEPYRAKTILSLAAVASNMRDYQSQFRYLIESAKASSDISTRVKAHLGVAIYKGREGFHQQSVRDLENLYTLARYAHPLVFFDYLNSLAVELGEVGRKDEARNIMRVVLASPYARVYPEWRETAKDLRTSRHSFLAFDSPHYNVLAMPEREPSNQPVAQPMPAQILNFAKLKKKIIKKAKDRQTAQMLDHMSLQDMGFKLLDLITKNNTTKQQMRIILTFVIQLFSKPGPPSA